jgi:hypothetical protein
LDGGEGARASPWFCFEAVWQCFGSTAEAVTLQFLDDLGQASILDVTRKTSRR